MFFYLGSVFKGFLKLAIIIGLIVFFIHLSGGADNAAKKVADGMGFALDKVSSFIGIENSEADSDNNENKSNSEKKDSESEEKKDDSLDDNKKEKKDEKKDNDKGSSKENKEKVESSKKGDKK